MVAALFTADGIQTALSNAVGWFSARRSHARVLKGILLLAGALYLLTVALFQTGPINIYGNDALLLLDGGWRFVNGQVPYRDFYLALGPLEYMLTALGMLLTHNSPQAIAVGNALFGMAIGAWGWFLCRRRMPDIPAALITAWLIITATSPASIDVPLSALSCAMIYNRHGYAILGLILVECAFVSERSQFWGGVSSGAALMLLAFLKLNFFAAGFLVLLASVPLHRKEMQRALGVLTGSAGIIMAFLLYLRSAMAEFIRDMNIAIHARAGQISLHGILKDSFKDINIVTVVLLSILTVILIRKTDGWLRFAVRIIALCAIAIVGGYFISATDAIEKGCHLAPLWELILIALLATAYPAAKEKFAIAAIITLSMASVYISFIPDLVSYKYLLRYQKPSLRAAAAHISGMEQLRFYEMEYPDMFGQSSFENGPLYASCINDGRQLLLQNSASQESVLTLGFHNPFPYVLRRKPARGGSVWLLLGNNISTASLLSETQVFGNADLIMLPSYPSGHRDTDAWLQKTYHAYLENHFAFVAKSQWWSLYRRKN